MKTKLSAEAFTKILQVLDPDREIAAAKYNKLKESLEKRVKWLLDESGCFDVDVLELVDEAFDRMSQKLLKGEEISAVGSYLAGVCRYLIMEYRRRPERRQAELDETNAARPEFRVPPNQLKTDEPVFNCLDKCLMSALSEQDRRLIVKYYDAEENEKNKDNRKNLADEFALSYSNLRSRTKRIRDRLKECIEDCVAAHNEKKIF